MEISEDFLIAWFVFWGFLLAVAWVVSRYRMRHYNEVEAINPYVAIDYDITLELELEAIDRCLEDGRIAIAAGGVKSLIRRVNVNNYTPPTIRGGKTSRCVKGA